MALLFYLLAASLHATVTENTLSSPSMRQVSWRVVGMVVALCKSIVDCHFVPTLSLTCTLALDDPTHIVATIVTQ